MGAALRTQLPASPQAFDEHYSYRAYSVAMMARGGTEIMRLMEGKVYDTLNVHFIVSLIFFSVLTLPSALARPTTLNFRSPWMFQLRNPENAVGYGGRKWCWGPADKRGLRVRYQERLK
jgi:hypothetical protein